jgi:uncharacterized protein with FMN-binding domain
MTAGKKIVIATVAVVLPAFIIGYNATREKAVLSSSANNNTNNSNTNRPSTTIQTGDVNTANVNTAVEANTQTVANSYRDGEYAASGNYYSPGGQESVQVTLTLSNDVVTAVSVDASSRNPTSRQYQNRFIGGVESAVVGKTITSLHLSRVSGSSLTTNGFNAALEKIKTEAAI